MFVGTDEVLAYISAMSQQISAADRFGAFAVRSGIDENDPMLVRAVEALGKIKRGESSSEEVDAALDPLFEAWNKEVREASPRAVAIAADSNSFRAAPLLNWAKGAGIDGSDPLLARALKAQEKADWRTSWASWLEMEIAVQAFVQAHFEIKNAWPPDSGQIEEFLQKLEKGNLDSH